MELNVILLWVECVIHFATFLILWLYKDHSARQRWGVSMCAIGLAASNVGLAVLIALGVIKAGAPMVHVLLILAFGCMFGLLVRARGNVAKMIQPLKPGGLTP
jgi:hypothetical protein